MRIGIDASCWWNRRGFGRFTRELLKALFECASGHKFYLFIDQPPEPEMECAGVHPVRVPTQRAVTRSALAASNRSLHDVWRFSRAAAAQRLDVMFYPAVYSWFPMSARVPSVVTLHDAIAEHFPELVFPQLRGRLLWTLKVRLACHQARRLVTVSEAARREIERYLGIPARLLEVVGEGVDPRFRPIRDAQRRRAARANTGLPAEVPLLLYVGALAPHKNLGNLLRGFAAAARVPQAQTLHLALVGDLAGDGFHANAEQVLAQLAGPGMPAERVHCTGFIDDDDLIALYSDALAVVLPSFSEGFGLPALEAMACGTPVLCSRDGALPDVVGGAGLTYDPHDPAAIGDAILAVSGAPARRAALAAEALERARRFTWADAADRTLAVLEACGQGR